MMASDWVMIAPASSCSVGTSPLRIDREIGGVALFALAKVVRQVIRAQALQVQRYSDPIGRAAAEIAVQLHRNLPLFLLFAQVVVCPVPALTLSQIVSMLSIYDQQERREARHGSRTEDAGTRGVLPARSTAKIFPRCGT